MLKIMFALFLILHSLVHVLYLGQSRGYFELQPGLRWPAGSWALASLLGENLTGSVASLLLALTAVLFAAAGLGLLVGQSWWRPLLVGAASLSAALYLLMWDGSVQRLDDQGAIGMLLDLALLLIVFILHWSPLS